MVTPPRLRTTIFPVVFALLAAFALAGCSQAQPSATDGSAQPPQMAPAEEPLHTSTTKVTGNELAVIKTKGKGPITFKFFPKEAPNTVASFIELADQGFYNGTTWHRVEPGFVIQGGDPITKDPNANPKTYGTGGPGWRQKAEFNQHQHLEGTVAMARAGDPDSAGSQFYICITPQSSLDGKYTVFGQVVTGLDVVHTIQRDDVIESITIKRGK